MTSITPKPHCIVCSVDAICIPAGPRVKFNICSKECQLELWRCLGIIEKSEENSPKNYSRRMGMTGEQMLFRDTVKEKKVTEFS